MDELKVGDMVVIINNPRTPSSIGKKGIILSVAHDRNTGEPLYKVKPENAKRALPGWAEADCIKRL